MATIDNTETIKKLLLNNGYFEDDPQVYSIWSYESAWGKKTCAVYYSESTEDILASPFVHEPELLWNQRIGITKYGKKWLGENA